MELSDVYIEYFDPNEASKIRGLIEDERLKFKEHNLTIFLDNDHHIYEILQYFKKDLQFIFKFLTQLFQIEWINKILKSGYESYHLSLLLLNDEYYHIEGNKFRSLNEVLEIMEFFEQDRDHLSLLYLSVLIDQEWMDLIKGEFYFDDMSDNDITVLKTLITKYKDKVNYEYFFEYEAMELCNTPCSEMVYVKGCKDLILTYEKLINYNKNIQDKCSKFIDRYIECDGKDMELITLDELVDDLYRTKK